jgi:hypothetical protein
VSIFHVSSSVCATMKLQHILLPCVTSVPVLEVAIVICLVTRAMSTKHVESEARVMSLVLIEGLAQIKRF